MSQSVVVVRIALAALFGAVLGMERELKGQPAGLRTHMLVAVGACLFTLVGVYAYQGIPPTADGVLRADITRVASQVVVGIGFLGGGAILRHGASVRGLTTAANLWTVSAVGLTVGFGFYFAAAVTTGVVLGVLAGLKPLERWLLRHRALEPGARAAREE